MNICFKLTILNCFRCNHHLQNQTALHKRIPTYVTTITEGRDAIPASQYAHALWARAMAPLASQPVPFAQSDECPQPLKCSAESRLIYMKRSKGRNL